MQSDTLVDVLSVKTRGVVRLTRWKEFVPFTIPVTIFGAILAVQAQNVPLDWRLLVVIIANILVVAYAFMINDIEDAPDDALEAHRAARNAITNGELTPQQGWLVSGTVAIAALILYALVGVWPLAIGGLALVLAHCYSWKPIRLKAWPVTDILSHSLMLSGLLFLVGYFAYHTSPGLVWLVALAATLMSVYGQIYNQLRDYDMDKAAGLKNTVIVVGPRIGRVLMYGVVVLATIVLLYVFYMRVIPLWLLSAPIVATVILAFVRMPMKDARGGTAADISGNVQMQSLIVLNFTIAVWLLAVMLHLG